MMVSDGNRADGRDDLDMDQAPPPRRQQAGPSNIFTQLMGGSAGHFAGFRSAAPPEYV